MKTLREIKKRIGSIQKTQEITNAMKVIASIRLRNAHRALYEMRPYSDRLAKMIQKLLTHESLMEHPLFKDRSEQIKKTIILVFTGDRGLCGAYNSNIIKFTEGFIEDIEEERNYFLITIGKKGYEHFKKNPNILSEYMGFRAEVEFKHAREIGKLIIDNYLQKEVGDVCAIYNKYHPSGIQETVIEKFLPLKEIQYETLYEPIEYIYEPSKQNILDALLPLYVNVKAWRLLQESSASEQAARMVSMETASNNCSDMLEDLTLKYNKARQASITAELLDVIGTSEAVSGG